MFRQLSKVQNAVFRLGAVLMLVGITVNIFSREASFGLYSLGMAMFCIMQVKAQYLGSDFTVARLRRQQLIACLFFFLASVAMSMQVFQYGFARRNEWLVMLTVACVLEVYTSWRIPAALSKAKKS